MFIFKVISSFLYEKKITLLIYIICTILAFPLEAIIIPQIYSRFFNAISQKNPNKEVFIKYFLIILFFLIIINISLTTTNYIEAKIIPELNEYIMNYIYKYILIKYENNYSDLELGKIITRLNAIPSYLKSIISDVFVLIFPRLLTIIVLNIYFCFINWKLGLVSFILLFTFLFLNFKFFKTCSPLANKRYSMFEDKNEETQDKLSNLYSIYSNGNIYNEIDNYNISTNLCTDKYKESYTCLSSSMNFSNRFNIFIFIILNSVTTYFYLKKEISFNNLMAIFITIIYYSPCLVQLSASIPDFINYWGSLSAIDDFIEDLYKVSIKSNVENFKENKKILDGTIIISNLNFKYNKNNSDKYIFKDFNLRIKNNEKIAIVGASGNGKSTLIKLIMGYYEVPNNSIFIDDVDINKYNLSDLRNQISFVNQNNKLFNTTILKNIQYGNKMTEPEINELIKKLHIENIFKNLENGLNSEVGINGDNLSGGQRQMVYFLRCIGKKNKIIILDEPTAAVDKNNTENIVRAIKELCNNTTVIFITHDEGILHMADRILTLDAGKIIKDLYQNNSYY